MTMERDTLLGAYRTMVVSRRFDERCGALVQAGDFVPHYHSGIGQEALMVASVTPLRAGDQIIYTHRGYGHLLAKGVSLREVALDTFMKLGGTNHGFGGNMHVARPDLGVPGREGVFGTRFGIAAGLGLAAVRRGAGDVVVCYYGEAAGARGILYESLNMAVLWRLPIVYIAENNGWSVQSRTEWLYPGGRMTRAWRGFDIPVEEFDGNDAVTVHDTVAAAVARARAGDGPSVLEGITFRMAPHIWWDDASYVPEEELERWRERDPLRLAAERLRALGVGSDELAAAEGAAREEVEAAFAAVDAAPDATWQTAKERMAA
jgi:TPP-dependent pyruvate/acetoin dehydrogenase alpha subunit